MRSCRGVLVATVFALLGAGPALAHQPVMDMAPRWQDGWGVQVRHESRFSDDLLAGSREVPNPIGREQRTETTWLEGIYTFRREVRATVKIPWVQRERVSNVGGRALRTRGDGLGDVVLGVPLRKYWNLEGWTANVGLTPSLRIPTGSTSDAAPTGDGSWDFGLSTSFSAESPMFYVLADVFWWANTRGSRGIDPGDLVGFDLNVGLHPYHDDARNLGIFVMLDLEARYEGRGRDDLSSTMGGRRLTAGPVLVAYWNNVMARAEIKIPVSEDVFGTQLSRGTSFNLGIGVAF